MKPYCKLIWAVLEKTGQAIEWVAVSVVMLSNLEMLTFSEILSPDHETVLERDAMNDYFAHLLE